MWRFASGLESLAGGIGGALTLEPTLQRRVFLDTFLAIGDILMGRRPSSALAVNYAASLRPSWCRTDFIASAVGP